MARPHSWGEYRRLVGGQAEVAGLNRFCGRYQFAAGFRGVQVAGIADSTRLGYEAGLRLTLSYSPLEALEQAIQARNSTPIYDVIVAADLRGQRGSDLVCLLLEDRESRPALAGRIDSFLAGEHDDLRPFVEKVRHLVSHGVFTAHGSGSAQSAKRRRLLGSMAEVTLNAADERFTQWVYGLSMRRGESGVAMANRQRAWSQW